jgi:hypothetical protein
LVLAALGKSEANTHEYHSNLIFGSITLEICHATVQVFDLREVHHWKGESVLQLNLSKIMYRYAVGDCIFWTGKANSKGLFTLLSQKSNVSTSLSESASGDFHPAILSPAVSA